MNKNEIYELHKNKSFTDIEMETIWKALAEFGNEKLDLIVSLLFANGLKLKTLLNLNLNSLKQNNYKIKNNAWCRVISTHAGMITLSPSCKGLEQTFLVLPNYNGLFEEHGLNHGHEEVLSWFKDFNVFLKQNYPNFNKTLTSRSIFNHYRSFWFTSIERQEKLWKIINGEASFIDIFN